MNLKKTTLHIFFTTLLLSSCLLLAQGNNNQNKVQQENDKDLNRCATDAYNAELLKSNPKMMGSKAYEAIIVKQIRTNKANRATARGAVIYTIPIVVHVLHNGEAVGVGSNISEAQILSQIKVLNDDYRRMLGTRGYNTNTDGADVEIEFCLAKQSPNGCPTNGINRINIGQNGIVETSLNNALFQMDMLKPSSVWDSSQYMNMWSVAFNGGSGILGYAQFPEGPADTDGVVADYRYFGSDDDPDVTISGDFNLGRTMTHEVGHYLGLFHTFQGGCGEIDGGDLCADTPAVASPSSNGGICISNNSCPAGNDDMIENYMDYSTDVCMNVFTNDQKARIIATMTGASNRPSTLTSNKCNALASVNDDASINIEQINLIDCTMNFDPTLRITNWGTVALTSATITYDVDGSGSTNYNWTGTLNYGESEVVNLPIISAASGNHTFNTSISNPNGNSDLRSCNDVSISSFDISQSYSSTSQVHLTLIPDNFGSETTWEFRDSSNTLLYSGGPYTNNDTTTINESFDVLVDECYTYTIFDTADDGICCVYGVGSYDLKTDDNTVIVSGGAFGDSETTRILTTTTLGINEYFKSNNINIYPNPTANVLNIRLANSSDLPDSYEIYNMLGQLVNRRMINNISQLTIDATYLPNGMYFVKVIKEGRSISIPFIKK